MILITDGEVGASSVEQADQLLGCNSFDTVQCHIVSPKINLSVTCPFTRNNNSMVCSYKNGPKSRKVQLKIKKVEYAILNEIDACSVEEF